MEKGKKYICICHDPIYSFLHYNILCMIYFCWSLNLEILVMCANIILTNKAYLHSKLSCMMLKVGK